MGVPFENLLCWAVPPQRVVLLDHDKETGLIQFRHFAISVAPSGVSKVRRPASAAPAAGPLAAGRTARPPRRRWRALPLRTAAAAAAGLLRRLHSPQFPRHQSLRPEAAARCTDLEYSDQAGSH